MNASIKRRLSVLESEARAKLDRRTELIEQAITRMKGQAESETEGGLSNAEETYWREWLDTAPTSFLDGSMPQVDRLMFTVQKDCEISETGCEPRLTPREVLEFYLESSAQISFSREDILQALERLPRG